MLDGFQAGLSWITILKKREAFRAAFDNFDPEKVARYGDADRARLMADAGIIRSNGKIDAAISGPASIWTCGKRVRTSRNSCGASRTASHCSRIREPDPGRDPARPRHGQGFESRGYKYCGPVIVYAFMQAVGLTNDHLVSCFRHDEVRRMAKALK
ncbi:MAG: DNA-3-methyladenine glycosylase I [Caulobacteraceae bacterium]